jgi:hypothetical protein
MQCDSGVLIVHLISELRYFRMCHATRFVAFISFLVFGGVSTQGEDRPDSATVIAGFRTNRESLWSGVYRAVGTLTEDVRPIVKGSKESASTKRVIGGNVSIDGAFDFQNGFRFFSRKFAEWKMAASSPKDTGKQGGREKAPSSEFWRIYARTPTASYHFSAADKKLEIWQSDIITSSTMDTAGWMDIRGLALYAASDLDLFEGQDLNKTITTYLPEPTNITVEDGLIKLSYISKFNELSEYWFDPTKGYAIIRFTRRPARGRSTPLAWGEPDLVNDLDWKEINDVWVPVSYHGISRVGESAPPQVRQQEWIISIVWDSVNQPIDKSIFDYNNFNLPFGTQVFDKRSGMSTTVAIIGVVNRPPIRSVGFWTPGRLLVLAVNLAVILVLAIVIIWRRAKSRKTTDSSAH